MRAVVQRVSQASVTINGDIHGAIHDGLLILLGIEETDTLDDLTWLVNKIISMRIFSDTEGKMNLSIKDINNGAFLVISQFTLYGSTRKGNRPSFIRSARPDHAIPLYETFLDQLRQHSKLKVESGVFGADMKVALVNDGPVTIIIDSKLKE